MSTKIISEKTFLLGLLRNISMLNIWQTDSTMIFHIPINTCFKFNSHIYRCCSATNECFGCAFISALNTIPHMKYTKLGIDRPYGLSCPNILCISVYRIDGTSVIFKQVK